MSGSRVVSVGHYQPERVPTNADLAIRGGDASPGHAARIEGGWEPRFRQEGRTVFRWATASRTGRPK
ncbi:hypothetical protein [Thermoactinospora rubra]|uniref:hypothetical protein n=1 Tax=Thermoactinospora rubra TaxID=1088767 RepID=UPI00117C07A8|nr:hypothetical protein [Thermoactinospora rubra]